MIPRRPGDPRNRQELSDWMKRREEFFRAQGKAVPPLSPREYLMIERLRSIRPPYSLM